jgi:hypothetical protein
MSGLWILICCAVIAALYALLFVTAAQLHRERPDKGLLTDNVSAR